MCQEVFDLLCTMDKSDIELQIVLQCAPTLAGIKTSNLLIVSPDAEGYVRYLIKNSGLCSFRMVYDRHRLVFLVFRRELLENYLSLPENFSFLEAYGYTSNKLGKVLARFQKRYELYIKERKEFPHEMGLLLGYPLEDVEGFIANGGQNYLCSGYWKVYSNPEEKEKLFEDFDKVKDQMIMRLWKGKGICA